MKTVQKLRSIYKMKHKSFLAFLIIIPLVSCSSNTYPIVRDNLNYFATTNSITLYEGDNENLTAVERIFKTYDKLTDNYLKRDAQNIYKINATNDEVKVDEELYDLLKLSVELSKELPLFNPLCGSLVKKWKESLKDLQILDETTIAKELAKINSSSILFKENNVVQRVGEAEIDLGAIAKGYALDDVKAYFISNSFRKYLINAGYSSILLGEKPGEEGYYNVGLSSLENGSYLKLKKCFFSTSGVSEQGKVINDVTYSHIVNPITGSAINNYDSVMVVTSQGYLGDVLSTVMMMSSVDEIKGLEKKYDAKAIAIKDKKIVYKNESLEVLKH